MEEEAGCSGACMSPQLLERQRWEKASRIAWAEVVRKILSNKISQTCCHMPVVSATQEVEVFELWC
jgi:hypothetical protein